MVKNLICISISCKNSIDQYIIEISTSLKKNQKFNSVPVIMEVEIKIILQV